MPQQFLQIALAEIEKAASKPKHSLKLPIISTFSCEQNTSPTQRIVVLRGANMNSNEKSFIFFTDKRSQKASELKLNSAASALFYDPDLDMQLRMTGSISFEENEGARTKHWSSLSEYARKNYSVCPTPKTPIADAFDYDASLNSATKADEQFCVCIFHVGAIDIYKSENHRQMRALFKKDDNWPGDWIGNWCVP